MPIPVPTEPRTFKLTDDATLSGVRIHPDDREVDGGGYLEAGTRRLTPAHGFVYPRVEQGKSCPEHRRGKGEVAVPCEANFTVGERAAMREMVARMAARIGKTD